MSGRRLATLVAVVMGLAWATWAPAQTPTFTVEGPAQVVDDLAGMTPQGSVVVFRDGFEGAFPGTKWQLSGTKPTWGQTTKTKHGGEQSIYCARSGKGGTDWPGPYQAKAQAWAIRGPFDLRGATAGTIGCYVTCDLPAGTTWTDYLLVGASTDGSYFLGNVRNGTTGSAWERLSVDLSKLSNHPLGKRRVWFGFVFVSDASQVTKKGICVDDAIVSITKAGGASVAVKAAAAPTAMGAQVSVSLSAAAAVSVSICNLAGREVATLPPADLPAGVGTLLWNGRAANGTKAPPGRYLVRVTARSAAGTRAHALAALTLGP